MITRLLNLSKTHSFFLFGARGTGKTTLLKEHFKAFPHIRLDLLDPALLSKLQAYPQELVRMIEPHLAQGGWVIIDEVQKVPALLDVVHAQIEDKRGKFALSGSSARKLRRGGANLLAGRAFSYKLYPFLAEELGKQFSLQSALQWGLLPQAVNLESDLERALFLQTYSETYLQEEVVIEQLVRNLPPFRRFLQVSAQSNSQVLNYSKIAADVKTDPSNVRNYYQILEDTLAGFFLEPFHLSLRKRQRQSPKFYWFDCGVIRALAQRLNAPPQTSTYEYGKLFETFVINQIRAQLTYSQKQFQLSYLLTKDNAEVDLIIERASEPTLLIEIKSGIEVRDPELNSIRSLAKEIKGSKAVCLYRGEQKLISGSIPILPWQIGMQEIGITVKQN